MSIPSKQIGWSQESNLLYEILRQFNKLSCSLCSINQNALNNPCYVEILLGDAITSQSLDTINSLFTTIDGTSQLFTGITHLDLGSDKVSGYRLYGGKNLRFVSLDDSSKLATISSINDPCGVITLLSEGLFTNVTDLAYVNLPGITTLFGGEFESSGNADQLLYVNLPNLTSIQGNNVFRQSYLSELRAPLLKEILGLENLKNCNSLRVMYTPKLDTLGSVNCGIYDSNFGAISGATITLTLRGSLTTCNAGAPELDLDELLTNNTVTLITT